MIGPRWLAVVAALAATPAAEADRAFRRGDADAAARGYQRAMAAGDSSAVTRYNLGTALLHVGREEEARPYLEAAAAAGDPRLGTWAGYNAGHADLAPVAGGRVSDGREARLRRAVARYRTVLLTDPEDADARWNLELAERLLRRPPPAPVGGDGGGGDPRSGGGGAVEEPGGGSLDPAAVERILSGAERRDQAVQRERMREAGGGPPVPRDW